MATQPQFITTPKIGIANLTTGVTTRDGSASTTTVITAGASGTKVLSIVVKGEDNPADSIVILWLHDGTTLFMWREIYLGDPADATNTVTGYYSRLTLDDCVLPSGWSIRATLTVTPTAGDVNVIAFGGDF